MMKKFYAGLLLGLIFLSSSSLFAESPTEYLNDANNAAATAQEFVRQAEKTLEGTPDRVSMELAIRLYMKAGEMFEKAYKIYSALGPSYATPQDLEGARAALQNCLNNINEIKKRL